MKTLTKILPVILLWPLWLTAEPPAPTGITYGFEMEYALPPKGDPFGDANQADKSDTKAYPLDGTRTKEMSGNWEVRSVAFTNLADAVAAMKKMGEKLGGDRRAGGYLRSYHLRVRLPVSLAKASKENLDHYVVALSGESFLWRLENLAPALSTRQKTLQRMQGPDEVADRRAVRFKVLDEKTDVPRYDVELRGYTGELAELEKKAREIEKTFTTATDKDLQGIAATWTALNSRKFASLADYLDYYRKKLGLPPLDVSERTILNDADGGRLAWEVLLNAFEDHPGLTKAEKERIERANELFVRRLDISLKAFSERLRLDYQPYSEFREDYTEALSEWAREGRVYDAIQAANGRLRTDPKLEEAELLQSDRLDYRLLHQIAATSRSNGYETIDHAYERAVRSPAFARLLKENPKQLRSVFKLLTSHFQQPDATRIKKLIEIMKAVPGATDKEVRDLLDEQSRRISGLKRVVGFFFDCAGYLRRLGRRMGIH